MPQSSSGHQAQKPEFSMVVIAYNMERELPRTLYSLSRKYQQDIADLNYEVIVVDNGSKEPVSAQMVADSGDEFRLIGIDDASPSPGDAVNTGVASARGKSLGILVDGARMLTPGVLAWAKQALRLRPRSLASVLGFHLGPAQQRFSSLQGYNQGIEDQLLDRISWPQDGYRLFEIASLAGSSSYGWQGPMAESNCLFLPRALFEEINGFDTRFESAGGGLINLDFYKRACEAGQVELVYLLGEGCFHQIHGGVTTGGTQTKALGYDQLCIEYESIVGSIHQAPTNPPLLLGYNHPSSCWVSAAGATALAEKTGLQQTRREHWQAVGMHKV
jgi:hypothetical protein